MDAFPSNLKFLLLRLQCTIMFNSVICNFKVHYNKKDMHRLLQGVIDPSGLLPSWLTEQDCCHWTGVECDNITGRVTELSLPCHAADNDDKSHCLRGELNLSLLQLEFQQ
ncbi:unnamed protein product [Sphenostylis stenocarpa]|uniref:Leucine-rich repeat-containing N-terminal plant-type domain-containing protein n=1 Tax=Sphenostylis stenocarpa TaxID=92480 RepID=A0AA87B7D0_9FABA|nr:unnamed protein product [Sphenostylis stenocarpa]